MEKISGIIPGSSRVKGVDLASSAPVRPGTPSFGRPVGVSTLASPKMSTAERATLAHENLMNMRKPMDPRAKIVKDMADGFFMNKSTEPIVPSMENTIDTHNIKVPGVLGEGVQMAPLAGQTHDPSRAMTEEEMDLPEVGRYIDVSA